MIITATLGSTAWKRDSERLLQPAFFIYREWLATVWGRNPGITFRLDNRMGSIRR